MAEQVGRYNRKIDIMQRSGVKDAAGEWPPGSWAIYKTVWSMIRGRNGMAYIREIGAANGTTVEASIDLKSFRVNYREDITTDMSIRFPATTGTLYDIVNVRPDSADRNFTDIIVRTGGSDG